MTTQREKDIEHWNHLPPNESHSETYADGAEYGRNDGRKDAARKLRALLHGYGVRSKLLTSFIEELEQP